MYYFLFVLLEPEVVVESPSFHTYTFWIFISSFFRSNCDSLISEKCMRICLIVYWCKIIEIFPFLACSCYNKNTTSHLLFLQSLLFVFMYKIKIYNKKKQHQLQKWKVFLEGKNSLFFSQNEWMEKSNSLKLMSSVYLVYFTICFLFLVYEKKKNVHYIRGFFCFCFGSLLNYLLY